MSLYNPEGTPPVMPNTVARIERRLPHPGEVLVRVGQRVEAEDIVAKAFVPAVPRIVNIAQELAIPASQVERALRREVGNKITRNEPLAQTLPVIGRSYIAPVSGIISTVDNKTGYVTITPDPEEYTLTASAAGLVMDILPHRGVIIETPAIQIYGAFGFGNERSGVLRLLVTDPNEPITPEMIDPRSAYSILIGGSGISVAALWRAAQQDVRGIILGSVQEREVREFLNWKERHLWRTGAGTWEFPPGRNAPDPGLTLLVTEGFGEQPMAQPIFDLLSSKDRQEALLEGATSVRRPLKRPRIIIPLRRSTAGDTRPPQAHIQPGSTVRLLDAEHLGEVAIVKTVATLPQRLPSGVRAPAVEVVQHNDPQQSFWLPRTAVEVLA